MDDREEFTIEETIEQLIKELQYNIKRANLDIKVEVTKNSINLSNI